MSNDTRTIRVGPTKWVTFRRNMGSWRGEVDGIKVLVEWVKAKGHFLMTANLSVMRTNSNFEEGVNEVVDAYRRVNG